jgi:hypothetical protein
MKAPSFEDLLEASPGIFQLIQAADKSPHLQSCQWHGIESQNFSFCKNSPRLLPTITHLVRLSLNKSFLRDRYAHGLWRENNADELADELLQGVQENKSLECFELEPFVEHLSDSMNNFEPQPFLLQYTI